MAVRRRAIFWHTRSPKQSDRLDRAEPKQLAAKPFMLSNPGSCARPDGEGGSNPAKQCRLRSARGGCLQEQVAFVTLVLTFTCILGNLCKAVCVGLASSRYTQMGFETRSTAYSVYRTASGTHYSTVFDEREDQRWGGQRCLPRRVERWRQIFRHRQTYEHPGRSHVSRGT